MPRRPTLACAIEAPCLPIFPVPDRLCSRMGGVISGQSRLPLALNDCCLVLSRPRWHRHPNGRERLIAERTKLEVDAKRYRKAHACLDRYHFLLAFRLPPHLAPPRQNEPYFLNCFVRYRSRCLAGRKLEMRHAPAPQSK